MLTILLEMDSLFSNGYFPIIFRNIWPNCCSSFFLFGSPTYNKYGCDNEKSAYKNKLFM